MTTAAEQFISAETMGLESRYVWKEVNFEFLVYDRIENIYIPEQVYWSIIMEN